MIIPIIAGTVAIGGAVACWRGVTMVGGSLGGVPWRVKFACWRYFAEIKPENDWIRVGTYGLKGHDAAGVKAKNAAVAIAAARGTVPPGSTGMISVTRATSREGWRP